MSTPRMIILFSTVGAVIGLTIGIACLHYCGAIAGDLEPTAPPGPTMKTLDEVEARIPIPGSSSPTGAFVITSPGSYYLTGDRHADGMGIVVTVDNVTIDLNGYSLIGGGYDVYAGIGMNSEKNVEIRNGTIRNFQSGILESNSAARSHRVINVRAVSNSLQGIHLRGGGHLVKDCIAGENGTSASTDVYGIYVETSGTVTGCTVLDNGASALADVYGIYGDAGSKVRGNTASHNGNYASGTIYGIYAGEDNTVTNNIVCWNGREADEVYGIYADEGSSVIGNTAADNGYAAAGKVQGIHGALYGKMTGNTSGDNGDLATGFAVRGIWGLAGCTVTGNTAYSNGTSATGQVYGITCGPGGHRLIDQNTAYDNNTAAGGTNMDYDIYSTYGVNEY